MSLILSEFEKNNPVISCHCDVEVFSDITH